MGQDDNFPVSSDERVNKALRDPDFLALKPEDQVAVLQHYKDNPVQPEGAFDKLTRGASRGFKQGVGINEDTDLSTGKGILKGGAEFLGNTLKGLNTVGNAAAEDVSQLVSPKPLGDSKLYQATIGNAGRGLWDSGTEAWKGYKNSDPEMFAHGFTSMVTQAAQLALMTKKAFKTPTPRNRVAGVVDALDAKDVDAANIEKAMPVIIKESQKAGIRTVGEYADTVQRALDTRQQQFSQAIANLPQGMGTLVDVRPVAQAILNLETPSMSAADVRVLKKAAREYNTPGAKRMDWVEDKRNVLNKFTSPLYEKGMTPSDVATKARNDLEMGIARAARSKIADIQYDVVQRNNPRTGINYKQLKQEQSTLMALTDFLGDRATKAGEIAKGTGKLGELNAAQLKHDAPQSIGDKFHTGLSLSGHGTIHGYVGGVRNMFPSPGPLGKANIKMGRAFGGTYTTPLRSAFFGLPIAHLATNRRETPYDLTPPPVPDEQPQ